MSQNILNIISKVTDNKAIPIKIPSNSFKKLAKLLLKAPMKKITYTYRKENTKKNNYAGGVSTRRDGNILCLLDN